MAHALVLGAGPDALRAAAVRATRASPDAPVLLLQEGPGDSGLEAPDLPLGTGRMRTQEADWELTEQVLGALVAAADLGQGVAARGHVLPLPLGRRQVARLIEPTRHLAAVLGWVQARRTVASQTLVAGGGQEERSYEDWVVRRLGRAAYEALHADYATRRFGADPTRLSVTVARVHHALPDGGPHQVAGGRDYVALQEAADRVRAGGGRIRSGVRIARIERNAGRAVAVVTQDGERIAAEGPIWVARPPAVVAGWIDGEADWKADARALEVADLLVLCLKGEVDGLPEVLHVLEKGAPFWQVVTPYGIKEFALFYTTLAPGAPTPDLAEHARAVADAARRLGIGDFEVEGARQERHREHLPVWTHGVHAHLHRVVDAYQAMGLVAVGRRGTLGFLDPAEEIRLAAMSLGPGAVDQRENLRVLVDPPARLDDLRTSVRRFIER